VCYSDGLKNNWRISGMTFHLTPIVLNDGDWLNECPYCKGNNLHQSDVSVYNPANARVEWQVNTEKSKITTQTQVTHVLTNGTVTTTTVDADATSNPSQERQGLTIDFWCETCENKPVLAIFQHKGITFMGWK
jgi:hypothetical protein